MKKPKLTLIKTPEEPIDSNFVISHLKQRLYFWAFVFCVLVLLGSIFNLMPEMQ